MVQPKYSPTEALNKIKLMMNYDSSKTLNENKNVIFEQSQSCNNPITYDELLTQVETVESAIDDTDNWTMTKDIVDSYEEAKEIYDAVKSVVGKEVYDEEVGKCVSAIQLFKTKYKEINSQDWIGGNGTLETDLSHLLKLNLSSESNRFIRLTKQMITANKPTNTGSENNSNTTTKKKINW
jgi:hypothetical protein